MLEFGLCFFCFFPFLKLPILHTGTDIQPYALIMAIIIYSKYILLTGVKIDKNSIFKYLIIFLSAFTLVIGIMSGGSVYMCFRSCLGYISLVIISLSIHAVLKKHKEAVMREEWIKAFINIWGVVGIIQKIFKRDFMYFIIAQPRTTDNRGVVGLASEPSFYGYMCIFFVFFALQFRTHNRLYVVWSVLQLVLLAQSSVGVLYLCVIFACMIIYELLKINIEIFIGIVGVGMFLYYLAFWIVSNNQHTRLGALLFFAFQHSPSEIFVFAQQDESIATRIGQIEICIRGFVSNLGMPHGFASYNDRLESGYGAVLYEMGILGAVIIFSIWKTVYKGYLKQYAWVVATSLSIIMFSAVQLSLPLLGFFIGICEVQLNQNSEFFKYREM